MSTYLQLCNKVINEGGFEQNELTDLSWGQPEAGRRMYPRVKRAVASAWEDIQMSRNEWEFNNKEITTLIYPRFLVDGIVSALPSSGPAPGVVYRGVESGLELTVVNVLQGPESDSFYIDFVSDGSHNRAAFGETFEELSPNPGDSSFEYVGRGAYRLRDLDVFMREPRWDTFVGYQERSTPIPITFIPWKNWLYKEMSYTTTTRSAPTFVSQDYKGDITFYPQTLSPFNVNFIYPTGPQILTDWDDVPSPTLLPEEYHDWIAWKALSSIARYDKNPDLMAWADGKVDFYKKRAERNLMPIPSWSRNRYNGGYWPARGVS